MRLASRMAVGLGFVVALGVAGAQEFPPPGGVQLGQTQLPQNPLVNPEEPPPGIEVQGRGPLHEAFAQPNSLKVEPGPAIDKEPPPPIPEEPPEERPEGENVHWIPGYWAWDADRNEFLWVTGVYRQFPPDRQFVPGYWTDTGEGWRWVPGFWAPVNQPDLTYVPPPPAPMEVEPAGPAPANSIYVSGYWAYNNAAYVWRPGYWVACQPGWVWTPPRYIWTPSGYIFVNGYWDYPFGARGLLFAPVYFQRPLWLTAGWHYRPSYCITTNILFTSLFARPGYASFYFGDYYGPAYANRGFRPWTSYRHDPLYGYYNWYNTRYRNNPNWGTQITQIYVDRGAGRAPRPPRTLVEQKTVIVNNNITINQNKNFPLPLARLDQVKQTNNTKLVRMSAQQLKKQQAFVEQNRDVLKERRKFESSNKGGVDNAKQVKKFRLPERPGLAGVGEAGTGQKKDPGFKDPGKKFDPTVSSPKKEPTFKEPGKKFDPKQIDPGKLDPKKFNPKQIDPGKIDQKGTPKKEPGKTFNPQVTPPKKDPSPPKKDPVFKEPGKKSDPGPGPKKEPTFNPKKFEPNPGKGPDNKGKGGGKGPGGKKGPDRTSDTITLPGKGPAALQNQGPVTPRITGGKPVIVGEPPRKPVSQGQSFPQQPAPFSSNPGKAPANVAPFGGFSPKPSPVPQPPRIQQPQFQQPQFQQPQFQPPRIQQPRIQQPSAPKVANPSAPRFNPPSAPKVQQQPLPKQAAPRQFKQQQFKQQQSFSPPRMQKPANVTRQPAAKTFAAPRRGPSPAAASSAPRPAPRISAPQNRPTAGVGAKGKAPGARGKNR